MSRMIGTTVRGVRAPIIRPGDDLAQIVTDSVLEAAASEGFSFHDRDVVGVTEAVVAKAQGNYASTDDIAEDVRSKFGDHPIGVIFTGCFMSMLDIVGLQLTNLTAYNEYITDVIISVIVYLSAFSLVIKMMLTKRGKKGKTPTRTAGDAPAQTAEKGGESA